MGCGLLNNSCNFMCLACYDQGQWIFEQLLNLVCLECFVVDKWNVSNAWKLAIFNPWWSTLVQVMAWELNKHGLLLYFLFLLGGDDSFKQFDCHQNRVWHDNCVNFTVFPHRNVCMTTIDGLNFSVLTCIKFSTNWLTFCWWHFQKFLKKKKKISIENCCVLVQVWRNFVPVRLIDVKSTLV